MCKAFVGHGGGGGRGPGGGVVSLELETIGRTTLTTANAGKALQSRHAPVESIFGAYKTRVAASC